MELDRQTLLVICGAIIGLTLFGGVYLSPAAQQQQARHNYAAEDIRYKFQQEEAKQKKKKKKAPIVARPTYSAPDNDDGDRQEEPSVFDQEPQEEPPLD